MGISRFSNPLEIHYSKDYSKQLDDYLKEYSVSVVRFLESKDLQGELIQDIEFKINKVKAKLQEILTLQLKKQYSLNPSGV